MVMLSYGSFRVLCVGILIVVTSVDAGQNYQEVYAKIFNETSNISTPQETLELLQSIGSKRLSEREKKQFDNYKINILLEAIKVRPGKCKLWEFYRWHSLFNDNRQYPSVIAYLDHFIGEKFNSCGKELYLDFEKAAQEVESNDDLKILAQVFNTVKVIEDDKTRALVDPAGLAIEFFKIREPKICVQLKSKEKSFSYLSDSMRSILSNILPGKVQSALRTFLYVQADRFVKDKELVRRFTRVSKLYSWFTSQKIYDEPLREAMLKHC